MYYLSVKTSSPQITITPQICLEGELGHNPHGTKPLFRRGVTLASGCEVFICPAVASWSYEGTERLHWLHPAGGGGTAKRELGESLSTPLRTMQHTQSKSPPDPFVGVVGGQGRDRATIRGGGNFGCQPLLLLRCPACAASHTSQLISGQIRWPLISRTC